MSEPLAGPEVCRINIGPKQRAIRMRFGLTFLVIGLAVGAALLVAGVARPWRLTLFPLFAMAAAGVLQAREKT
jgi:hypothetical protein